MPKELEAFYRSDTGVSRGCNLDEPKFLHLNVVIINIFHFRQNEAYNLQNQNLLLTFTISINEHELSVTLLTIIIFNKRLKLFKSKTVLKYFMVFRKRTVSYHQMNYHQIIQILVDNWTLKLNTTSYDFQLITQHGVFFGQIFY